MIMVMAMMIMLTMMVIDSCGRENSWKICRNSRGDPDQMGQLPHGERWWVDDEEMMMIL